MKVLIAIDDFQQGEHIAEVAHRLFGADAEYMVINVAAEANPAGIGWAGMGWGAAYPLALPLPVAPVAEGGGWTDAVQSARERAEERAGHVVEAAHLGELTETLGDVGDPATAICQAAADNAVDVVVVGSHERSWFGRLFSRDVTGDVVRGAAQPVLVVS